MSTNVFQINALNTNLFVIADDGCWGIPYGGQMASEIPMVPDNLNKNLANMTFPMGTWNPYTPYMDNSHQGESSRLNGSWWNPTGSHSNHAVRPYGAFFSRVVCFTDELSSWGYVGTMCGGMFNPWYSLDAANGGIVDIEPMYGHGVGSWPVNIDAQVNQYRDANNLPSDGASRINTTGSTYNRSNRLHPAYFTVHFLQGGTIASGNVQVIVEQRPTSALTHGAQTFPFTAGSFNVSLMFSITQGQYEVLLSRIWGRRASVNYAGSVVNSDSAAVIAAQPPCRVNDPRTRQSATFHINPEYYGFVVDTWVLIYSNKTSFVPVYMKDLSTIWTSSAHPRIAGVVADPATLNMWVLSENGELAMIDMSAAGGTITPKASATTLLAAGERFGSMVKVGTIIYALVGSYADSVALPPASQAVGIVAYDTAANTWSVRRNYTGQARLTNRSIHEIRALSNGRLAALVESVGAGVLVPSTLKSYYALSTVQEIPAALNCVVVKLAGSDLVAPASSRFKLRYQLLQAHAIGATIKRVPAGSPAGTAWTDSAVITHGSATAWDNDSNTIPRTTDWINMPLDPAYDYYLFLYAGIPNSSGSCYDGSNGPRYAIYTPPLNTVVGNTLTGLSSADLRSATTVPNMGSLTAMPGVNHGAVVDVVNDSGTDTFTGVVNKGLASTSLAWQVLVYDPVGLAWNTNTLDNNTALLCPLTCRAFGEMYTPSAGKLLIQASPYKDRLFVFDYSGTLDNTKFTDLSFGGAGDIFPANWNTGLAIPDLTICQNSVDSSVLFHLDGWTVVGDTGYQAKSLGWAWPSFSWDGSEKIQQIDPNAFDNNVTRSLTKDRLIGCNIGSNNNMPWMMVPSFADTQVTFVHPGWESSTGNLYFPNAGGGTYYLPRYYKCVAGNWVVAKNWADAANYPMSIPTTPDTPVNGPWGMIFMFGPAANTTFLASEFHTLNVGYGFVKFARRARYTFTVFAGQTFQMTETKALSDLRAVTPVVHFSPAPAATGPSNLSSMNGHTTWPTYNSVGSYINDTPCSIVYDFSASAPGPSLIPPMTSNSYNGFVAAANGNENGRDPFHAFSKAYVNALKDPGSWCVSGGAGVPWLSIDMGTPTTALSYRLLLPICPQPGWSAQTYISGWKIQGSNDNQNWSDLHTVSGFSLGSGFPWGSPYGYKGHALPYLANLTVSGAYRYYRIIFPNNNGNNVGIGLFELFGQSLATSINFSDIAAYIDRTGPAYGMTFEVNTGSGYTPITPRFRSHHGEIYSFDRQSGVQQLRITVKNGRFLNSGTRYMGPLQLWDYGTQAVVNNARLGSSGAADATAAKGTYDSQCIGVNSDAVAVSVDGISPQQYWPAWCDDFTMAYRGWHYHGPWALQGASNNYIVHPYFGFVWFSPNVSGTNVKVAYAWGRRV